MSTTKRLEYLDLVKGFGILLVVLGHVYPTENSLKIWIYSFHMPLFFLISGILIKYTNVKEREWTRIVVSKFRGLIVPYIGFEMLMILYRTLQEGIVPGAIRDRIIGSIKMYSNGGATWYLPCLFAAEILFIFLIKYIRDDRIGMLISMAVFVLPFIAVQFTLSHGQQVTLRCFTGFGFIALGYYGYDFIVNRELSWEVSAALLAVNMVLGIQNQCVDLWGLTFGNSWLYVISAVTGCLAVINLFKRLKGQNVLRFLGKNTIIIMGTQKIVLEMIGRLTGQEVYGYLAGMAVFLAVMAAEVPTIYGINRYFPFILGKHMVQQRKCIV